MLPFEQEVYAALYDGELKPLGSGGGSKPFRQIRRADRDQFAVIQLGHWVEHLRKDRPTAPIEELRREAAKSLVEAMRTRSGSASAFMQGASKELPPLTEATLLKLSRAKSVSERPVSLADLLNAASQRTRKAKGPELAPAGVYRHVIK